jgi:hypothetical protein
LSWLFISTNVNLCIEFLGTLSMAQTVYCVGRIVVSGGPSAPFQCLQLDSNALGTWVFFDATLPFDPSQIDPTIASALFGAGFLLYLTPWATAWGFSQLLKLLR